GIPQWRQTAHSRWRPSVPTDVCCAHQPQNRFHPGAAGRSDNGPLAGTARSFSGFDEVFIGTFTSCST
ncbi:hypothetical protein, partial [Staphylococcus agnetis]|uniref:hypothetical protein n=1 Tax=Staphylococcus agnetis TaxID=985762 RepID=UPI0039EC560C